MNLLHTSKKKTDSQISSSFSEKAASVGRNLGRIKYFANKYDVDREQELINKLRRKRKKEEIQTLLESERQADGQTGIRTYGHTDGPFETNASASTQNFPDFFGFFNN